MFTREEILNYRCPRWGDWPNLDLYMDQVISLINENLSVFHTEDQSKAITPTMINNYVKQKIVSPSRQKKYGRDHIACFYIIFLLKPVLTLSDISDCIFVLNKSNSLSEAYDLFCDEIETALSLAFGSQGGQSSPKTDGPLLMRTIAHSFAYTHLAKYYIYTEKLSLSK